MRTPITPELILSKCWPEPMSGCWLWSSFLTPSGYGRYCYAKGKSAFAHRLSWEAHRGPIPDGLYVLHRCDQPSCVNPDHLFVGTHDDNMNDMVAKGRARAPLGERNAASKLTADDVREIKRQLAAHRFQKDIAADFGVTQSLISQINLGKQWGHVEGGFFERTREVA